MRFSVGIGTQVAMLYARKTPELTLCEGLARRLEPGHQGFPPGSAPGPGGSRRAGRLRSSLGAQCPTVGFRDT